MTTTAKPFEPSSWLLLQQIEDALRRCDASVEQARLAREAREKREQARQEDRRVRAWAAEVEARRRRALYGQP